MADVLDEIIERMSPSTLESVVSHGCDSLEDANNLCRLLEATHSIRNRRITRELQRKCFNLKSKSVENSKILAKLLSDLKAQESTDSAANDQQSLASVVKQLNAYNVKIREIVNRMGNINLLQLFNDIENLNEEIEKTKKEVVEAKNKYKCFDGLEPSIEGTKKVIHNIKEQIKSNERKIYSIF